MFGSGVRKEGRGGDGYEQQTFPPRPFVLASTNKGSCICRAVNLYPLWKLGVRERERGDGVEMCDIGCISFVLVGY